MKILRFLGVFLALFAALVCGGGSRPTVTGQSRHVSRVHTYQWARHAPDSDQVDLMLNGRQIGAWSIDGQYYLPIEGERWGDAGDPPVQVPHFFRRDRKKDGNFGIKIDQLQKAQGIYLHTAARPDGVKISRATAEQILQDGVPDDRSKPWIVVVGSKAKTDQVLADALKDPAMAGMFRIWAGAPGDWQLGDSETKAPLGYFAQIDPTLHLVAPDGELKAAQPGYAGPKDLMTLASAWGKRECAVPEAVEESSPEKAEAVRKVRPVDPAKVADPREALSPADAIAHPGLAVLSALSAFAATVFARRRGLLS